MEKRKIKKHAKCRGLKPNLYANVEKMNFTMGWYECNPSRENTKLKEQVHQND
jgi:hypothetical protein